MRTQRSLAAVAYRRRELLSILDERTYRARSSQVTFGTVDTFLFQFVKFLKK